MTFTSTAIAFTILALSCLSVRTITTKMTNTRANMALKGVERSVVSGLIKRASISSPPRTSTLLRAMLWKIAGRAVD